MFTSNPLKQGFLKQEPLNRLLLMVVILLVVSKLFLVGEGFMSLVDEVRYVQSGQSLKGLSRLEFKRFLKPIFYTQGRPGETIVKLIPSFMQWASAKVLGKSMYEPANSFPLFIFNVIVWCLILVVHFRFSRMVLGDTSLALLSVILFASLTNSHIYLRHALPYDTSLLVFYYAMYKTCLWHKTDGLTRYRTFGLGILAFSAYLIYPGYISQFLAVSMLLALYGLTMEGFRIRFIQSVFFVLGSLSCLLFFEFLSRVAGKSYIEAALKLSSTITQGSFSETFTFILKYLNQVEGIVGLSMIPSVLLFFFWPVRRFSTTADGHMRLPLFLGLLLAGIYLVHAGSGYFLHKIVFYGRLIHPYMPYICVFAVFPLARLREGSRARRPILAGLALFILCSGVQKIVEYRSIQYPRDIAWAVINEHNPADVSTLCEYGPCQTISPTFHGNISDTADSWTEVPDEKERESGFRDKRPFGPTDFLIVNGCYFYPVKTMASHQPLIHPGNGYRLVGSGVHFLNFKAYQYEAFDIEERRNLDSMDFRVRVYARPAGYGKGL
jgi:hypothetical protein